jgi:hypothetical protein
MNIGSSNLLLLEFVTPRPACSSKCSISSNALPSDSWHSGVLKREKLHSMDLLFFVCCAVLVLVAILVLYRSNKKSYNRIEILRHGLRVPGEIIELEFFGLFHRFPVVRFKTSSGNMLSLTSYNKVYISEFEKGQKVEVCYLPIAPEQFVIISGLDVLVKSETQATEGPYRLAKGQERRSKRRSR